MSSNLGFYPGPHGCYAVWTGYSHPVRLRLQVPSPLLWVVVRFYSLALFHTWAWESTGSLRVRGSLLCLPYLKFSSFILLPPGAPFPGSSDQKDGSFSPNISRLYHFYSSLPGSRPQYSTTRKTFGTRDLHPCCHFSKFWFFTTFWVSLLFISPGSCVLLFWHVLHFNQQERGAIMCMPPCWIWNLSFFPLVIFKTLTLW